MKLYDCPRPDSIELKYHILTGTLTLSFKPRNMSSACIEIGEETVKYLRDNGVYVTERKDWTP